LKFEPVEPGEPGSLIKKNNDDFPVLQRSAEIIIFYGNILCAFESLLKKIFCDI